MKDDGEVYYLIIQNIPWYVNQIYNLNIKYHWLFSTLILCESRVLPVTLFSSVQFSHSVMSYSLRPHGWQHTRLPCPSPTPRVCANSCPLSQWCHQTISSCRPLLLLLSIFLSIRVFSNESVFCIRGPKYWTFSFSISPSNEYSGLISFRMELLDLLAVQGTLKTSPTPQFKSINSLVLSFLYRPILI